MGGEADVALDPSSALFARSTAAAEIAANPAIA
jgi:hypothetical protein